MARDPRPNVIFLVVDTLRATQLGTYGYARRPTSPFIDELASDGTVFERCFAAGTATYVAVPSLLTGSLPEVIGVNDPGERVPTSIVTLAEVFGRAGYVTASVVASAYAGRFVALDRGFSSTTENFAFERKSAEELLGRAADLIDRSRARQARGLRAPKLVISDGHKGLTKALEKWPGCRLQRCTEHKRANLLQHCPAHARRELRRDYNRIVYAKNGFDARKAYDELVAKWTPLAPAVVRSLEEAGNQLLTFYEFPRAMWKSIRTTNALENLNREFRRRTKTQASFSSEESAVALLFGLIASGQIQLRRINGYQRLN